MYYYSVLILSLAVLLLLVAAAVKVGFKSASAPKKSDVRLPALAGVKRKMRFRLTHVQAINSARKCVAYLKTRARLTRFERVLYDNYYELILLADGERLLPPLPAYQGEPRLRIMIDSAIRNNDGKLDADILREKIDSFNAYGYLTYAEITSLIDLCKSALIEYAGEQYLRYTSYCASREKGAKDGAKRKIDFSLIRVPGYVAGQKETLSESEYDKFRKKCFDSGVDEESALNEDRKIETLWLLRADNVFRSLRELSSVLNEEFLLSLSKIDALYSRADAFYEQNDDRTKLECLRLTALRAKRSDELYAAATAIRKAKGGDLYTTLRGKPLSGSIYALLFSLLTVSSVALSVYLAFKVHFAFIFAFVPMLKAAYDFCVSLVRIERFTPRVGKSDAQAVIVIPTLINGVEEAKEAAFNARKISYANPDFDVCLLCDLIGDENPVREYFTQQRGLIILVRKKAWEKKRGALIDFNALILGYYDAFSLKVGALREYEYAITIDSDSELLYAERAVRAIEHPFFDKYSVLAFNGVTSFFSPENAFSRLFSFTPSQYYTATDIEYDVFGYGNFTGKGIYRVSRFYDSTAQAFRDGRVLSHDYIEGAFSGAAATDMDSPESAPETFGQSLARSSRWVRGDWQLIGYLGYSVRDRNGVKRKNPLSAVNKIHLLKSCLFSLLPLCVSLLLFFSALKPQLLFIAFLPTAVGVFFALTSPPRELFKTIAARLYEFCVLPAVACSYFYAIAITLIRIVRGKNLLVWQTFAHSRAKRVSLAPAIGFFAAFTFAAFYFYAWYTLFFAFVFLAGCFSSALENPPAKKESKERNKVFLEYCNTLGAYFRSSLYGAPRYLIPDNVSYENGKTSPQTSPTNIGFSLVSLLTLKRLSLMDDEEFARLTDGVIDSVYALEKFRGHLYNWYSTQGEPLEPKYVSSVDSGNFFSCLAAVIPHLSDNSRHKAREMLDSVDFSFLVDSKSKVLSTGYDVKNKSLDASKYDLYSSESLLTYVFCVGYGYISHDCALRLSRKGVFCKGNAYYSWTGGSFEYLMPAIFLPAFKGTAYYRSCITACKAQSAKKGFWGVSESQYDDFDDLGNRKYKAFGLSALALSEPDETVYSPYACALCAPFIPRKVLLSLLKATEMGMKGPLGLFEAYDGKPIKTYMAHHQGMTLCALALALGSEPLLNDDTKIRAGLEYFTFAQYEKKQKRKPRVKRLPTVMTISDDDSSPANYFTGGSFVLRLGARGETQAFFDGISVYDDARVFLSAKNETYSLFSLPARHVKGKSVYESVADEIAAEQEIAVINNVGEVRKITLRNTSNANKKGWIGVYYRPILNNIDAFKSHPTYSDLFVRTEKSRYSAISCARGLTAILHSRDFSATETDRAAVFRGSEDKAGVYPALLGSVPYDLNAGESKTFYTLLSCSFDEDKARAFCRVFDRRGGEAVFESAYYGGKSSSVSSKLKALCEGSFYAHAPLYLGFRRPIILLKVRSDGITRGISEIFADLSRLCVFTKFDLCVEYERKSGYFDEIKNKIADEFNARFSGKDVKCFFYDAICRKSEIEEIRKYAVKPYSSPAFAIGKVHRGEIRPAPRINKQKSVLNVECGYFTDDGFVITKPTPRAWYNVAATENCGFIASECGGGFVYFGSSYFNKITPYNFGVIDDSAQWGVIIEENGGVFSVPALPCNAAGERATKHGFGTTEYYLARDGAVFKQSVSVFDGGVAVTLEVDNRLETPRDFSLAFFAKLILGENESARATIKVYSVEGGIEAVNLASGLKCGIYSDSIESKSFSLTSITSADGRFVTAKPRFNAFAGDDAVIFTSLSVPPRAKKSKRWIFSASPIRFDGIDERIIDCGRFLRNLSPIKSAEKHPFAVMLPFLAYQTLSSRFYARSGPYQVGGAYGFRDQLQDCLAIMYFDSSIARGHILKCASKQFEKGDVLHWWHSPAKGVRSGYADDRLFLGYVTAKYISFTRDESILRAKIPFLRDTEGARYRDYESTDYSASLLDHIQRAIRSIKFSYDGLALMESGDWNDAMDKAGVKGKGGSVWLSIFLYVVINDCLAFLPYADFYRKVAQNLRNAVNSFYNGEYFARLVTDEGRRLGYDDGFIDLITQAWASASGIADDEKSNSALSSCDRLFDRSSGVVKLLWPPFSHNSDIGSIGDYPAGVRENGGQYTHGALWYALALYKAGKFDEAYEVLSALLPISHSTQDKSKVYGLEPYVIAADVYSGMGAGQGGWSWYTGSAAWAYLAIVEGFLGVKISGDFITVTPRFPSSIKSFSFEYARGGITIKFNIDNSGFGVWRARRNNTQLSKPTFSLKESGEYEIYKE